MRQIIAVMMLLLGPFAWAQDTASDDEAIATESEAQEDESDVILTEEELEVLDIDGQEDHTEEDEDVFKPTDVVSYQQSVQFPVDI